ncbi:hypothetical protein GCM10023085_11750 [Actinomadura viridis]
MEIRAIRSPFRGRAAPDGARGAVGEAARADAGGSAADRGAVAGAGTREGADPGAAPAGAWNGAAAVAKRVTMTTGERMCSGVPLSALMGGGGGPPGKAHRPRRRRKASRGGPGGRGTVGAGRPRVARAPPR